MTLRYRATVVLKREPGCAAMLMERYFNDQTDAATWCQVMTRALPQACGLWFVGAIEPGRTLTIVHEVGLSNSINSQVISEVTTRADNELEVSEDEATILGDVDANAMNIAPTLKSEHAHSMAMGA